MNTLRRLKVAAALGFAQIIVVSALCAGSVTYTTILTYGTDDHEDYNITVPSNCTIESEITAITGGYLSSGSVIIIDPNGQILQNFTVTANNGVEYDNRRNTNQPAGTYAITHYGGGAFFSGYPGSVKIKTKITW